MSMKATSVAPAVSWLNPRWSWKVWAVVAALLVPTIGFTLWVFAQANGKGDVTAITGTGHTVYHSTRPLPDAKAPQADGMITLVWFTNATCRECEKELFVHKVMADYRKSVVFVEKAIDRDTSAERLGVKQVPTFVWLDAEGNAMGSFGAVADEAQFREELAKMTDTDAALAGN